MTRDELKDLEQLLDKKLNNFPTKQYLQGEIQNVKSDLQGEIQSVKEGLGQIIRLTNSKLREDFKFALDKAFRKYMDKILRGQDKTMKELEAIREEQIAGQARDDRVDERFDRIEKHIALPPIV